MFDNRFFPIIDSEVADLMCAVYFLTDFEACGSLCDWEVGEHGLAIRFAGNEWRGQVLQDYCAMCMPHEPAVANWDKAETIQVLMRRAGHLGHILKKHLDTRVVTRFRVSKTEMTYEQYKEQKKHFLH